MLKLSSLSGVLIFTVAALVGSVVQAAPTVLPATSPWNMHYADDSCRLARVFGADKKKMFLRMEQTAPSEKFSVTLIGKVFQSEYSQSIPLTLHFRPGGEPDQRERALTGVATIGERLPLVIVEQTSLFGRAAETSLDAVERGPQAEANITELFVGRKGAADLVLKLGPMDKPMAALRTCTDGLVKKWGLDPTVQRSLRRVLTPIENPGTWLRSSDFPQDALWHGKSAIVRFRLVVDAQGGVTSCSVPSATENDGVEKITCDLLKQRARFTPALDADAKPVASYYTNSVTWLSSY